MVISSYHPPTIHEPDEVDASLAVLAVQGVRGGDGDGTTGGVGTVHPAAVSDVRRGPLWGVVHVVGQELSPLHGVECQVPLGPLPTPPCQAVRHRSG